MGRGQWKLRDTLGADDGGIWTVAFHPDGQTVFAGSNKGTINLWDVISGQLRQTLKEHRGGSVDSVVFDPSGLKLASGGHDNTVRLCESSTGKLIRTLEGHSSFVFSLAFDPTGATLASGAYDNTCKLWDASDGHLLRTLEGHTSAVIRVAFARSGRLLVTRGWSHDPTVRIWRIDTGACVATIPNQPCNFSAAGIVFHPHLPLLAVVSSESDQELDLIIHIWELDFGTLLDEVAISTVTYTSAKIVLVGESKVGKSYLAHRIATGNSPADGTVQSTHGMRFWPMEPERLSPSAKPPKRQRRDVVLWDMGGQDEYQLVHQLFLHDTTLALVLFDPTRGRTDFEDVEAWNKRLEKQLRGRPAVKFLVGAKLDQPSGTIDYQGLERLLQSCAFSGYYETSALNGRGVRELCEAMARAIDWESMGKTSRPELFQRIRDEIEGRHKRGEVVLHVVDLHRSLGHLPPSEEQTNAVDAVTAQLATQGVIARSRVSSGEPVLVLQVQEIERYAGSLILAARNNPRGVPALELRAVGQPDLALPGIAAEERLPRDSERAVIECTVPLLLEHGVCFQHEGLLVFPSLFAPAPATPDEKLPHAASLYYDFAGAIDNIYASLVAWLVLAKDFGRVRLWQDRAEFETGDRGLCGLRKVGRPGGFAHVDVYFDASTPRGKQDLFISFVEEHLRSQGVEIQEHLTLTCSSCRQQFDEETLRKRIARGDKDVGCPVCETRHSLTEGAVESRQRDPQIAQRTWALKTMIAELRDKITEKAARVIEKTADAQRIERPIRLLHISDLHFTASTPVKTRLQWLFDDLKEDGGLGFTELDYLVISGDFTDRGCTEGFEKAYEFVSGLTEEFALSAERCIFIPGNHDVADLKEAFEKRMAADGKEVTVQSDKYPLRFKPFSDGFYHKFLQRPYPFDYSAQGIAIPFLETGVQFLTLNSCWQIDQFNRKRAGLNPDAVAQAIRDAQKQAKQFVVGKPLLRIAVCHHAVSGPELMKDVEVLGNLQKNNVRIILHGDVHEMRRDLIGYQPSKQLHVVGSGSFGARPEDRPESTSCLYNVLEISRDLKGARVHTRHQPKKNGPWKPWNEWERQDGQPGALPYYDIKW